MNQRLNPPSAEHCILKYSPNAWIHLWESIAYWNALPASESTSGNHAGVHISGAGGAPEGIRIYIYIYIYNAYIDLRQGLRNAGQTFSVQIHPWSRSTLEICKLLRASTTLGSNPLLDNIRLAQICDIWTTLAQFHPSTMPSLPNCRSPALAKIHPWITPTLQVSHENFWFSQGLLAWPQW